MAAAADPDLPAGPAPASPLIPAAPVAPVAPAVPAPGAMLQGFAWLLLCQSAGEAVVRLTHAPLPGPVVGAMVLWALLAWAPARSAVGAAAEGLLAHLSLLFVPVGVGVVTHLALLSEYGGRIVLAVVVSTLLGMAATALVMRALMRQAPAQPPEPFRPDGPRGG